MKKRIFKMFGGVLLCSSLLTSCYTYTNVIGEGAKGNEVVTKWNHYVVYGLAPIDVSDSKVMAGGATNYTVKTEHTFVNGLIAAITFGIYTPTMTTVTK